jgi:hypothetical protein
VVNDELELAAPIDVIRDRVTDLTWAIDLAAGRVDDCVAAALRSNRCSTFPGSRVSRASAGYRG